MTAKEFFYLVAEMRRCQKSWLDTHDQRALIAAKMREQEVDAEIARTKKIVGDVLEVYRP